MANKKRKSQGYWIVRDRSRPRRGGGFIGKLKRMGTRKKVMLCICVGMVAVCVSMAISSIVSLAGRPQYMQLANLREHIFGDSAISDRISASLGGNGVADDFYAVFISVCDTQYRARVIPGTGSSVRGAWDAAERIAARYVNDNDYNLVWAKADIVSTMRVVRTEQLQQEIGGRDSYFRSGIAFDEKFGTAFIEEVLNGNAMLIYDRDEQEKNDAGDYVFNMANVNAYLKEHYGRGEIDGIPESVILFDTLAWFCDEGGEVYELYDSGYEQGRRITGKVDPDVVTPLIINGANYLRGMIKEDGEFVYGWFPITHRLHGSYNILRHAGTLWAMLNMTRVMGQDEEFVRKIDSAVAYLVDDYVEYREDGAAFVVERKADEIKLGGSGLSVIMLTEYMDVFGTDRYFDLVCRLADGILDMQNEDGSYVHVLHFPGFGLKDEYRTVFYDGEATFALSRAYSVTGDERYLEGAVRAIGHFIEEDYVQYRDHWLSYAVNEVTKYVQNPDFYDLALRNVQENLDAIWNFRTTSHIHMELLMIAWETYGRMLENGVETEYLRESFDVDYFVRTIYKRARFMLNGYFYPEFAMYMRFPSEVVDTFFIRQDRFRVRIDDVQHFIGGYYLYIKYYDQIAPMLTDGFVAEIDRTGFAVAEAGFDEGGDDDKE